MTSNNLVLHHSEFFRAYTLLPISLRELRVQTCSKQVFLLHPLAIRRLETEVNEIKRFLKQDYFFVKLDTTFVNLTKNSQGLAGMPR